MLKRRRIVAFVLMMTMSISSQTVFAADSMGTLQTKTLNNTITSQFKTVHELQAPIADVSETQKLNNASSSQVKTVSETDYAQTKAVADQKALTILNDSRGECTSLQYALIDNGKIVLSGNAGVYSKESNKAVTADNMYGIGSVSKMFVTTAIMKLVDEGKIKLDNPVTKYIKEFKMADARYKKITVRMLLNHSSGLMGTSISNKTLFGDNDRYAHDTFLKQLKVQRLKADPGAYSVYCNDGFNLAEILVEHVTGVSYTTYITNNITNTLKMNNTKTPVSEFDRDKLAKTYYNGISSALPVENVNTFGSGGIYSSAEDLCKFATTFTQNSNGILSKKALKAMENKEYLRGIWPDGKDNIVGYGLGWDSVNLYPFNQYNIKALSKGGDTPFYHSNLIVLPEQNMAVAVVSSGGGSIFAQIMGQEVLLAALKEKGVISNIIPDKTFNKPQKVAVPSEIKKYEGLYASGDQGVLDIKIDEAGTLNLSYPQSPQKEAEIYTYTKEGAFVSSDGTRSLKFVKESNGKTYLQQVRYMGFSGLGQVITNYYIAQKQDANKLTESVSKAWEERAGKKYYLLSEKYSSVIYMVMRPFNQFSFVKDFEGYVELNSIIDKIIDENSAVAILDGPGEMSRDEYDFRFYKKRNIEYVSFDGMIFVEEAGIKNLPTNDKFQCTINKNGYAHWYKIGDESADKEITVDMPQNAAFVVYDSRGVLVNDSLVTGVKSVKLPKDGAIAFLGSPQAKFTIQYKIDVK